jgi:RNA-directed DNA polymerase
MSSKRQKNQLLLAFAAESRDEYPTAVEEGIELRMAKREAQSPTATDSLMEEVCQRDNLWQALARVKANKGAPGVDGMTVHKLPKYLKRHWPKIREQLLAGTYCPQPVKRVEIPKPDGGVRKLGIPTALDRFIQQAVLQVLQKRWDRTFSEHSYGFRPKRSAHQAVAQAQAYIAEGYGFTVDIDLEKRLRCCVTWTRGSRGDFAASSGSSGNEALPASRNSASGAWAKTWRPKLPAAHADCGTSAAARHSASPYPVPTSTRSAYPA